VGELGVLHLCTADRVGGAARSAYKVHEGLRECGVRSRMLVGTQVTRDADVGRVAGGRVRWLDRAASTLTDRLSWQYLYLPSSGRLPRHPWVRHADVIQLYNTHGGYLSHTVLPRLAEGRVVVWRLSDMWAATGHCAYSGDCQKWTTGCQGCPDLATYPALRRDTAGMLFRRKAGIYERTDLHLVAPSNWIADVAHRSPLLSRFDVTVIPNGIATDVFRPADRRWARDWLGLPPDRPVALFAAHGLDANPRKGVEHVAAIVNRLRTAHGIDLTLALVGEGRAAWADDLPVPVARLGYLSDDRALALAYAAADVYLHPARLENLPNTVLEALACGTPAVAFDAGGVGDAVEDGVNGHLVPPGDVERFVTAVARILGLADPAPLRAAARRTVLDRFTVDAQTGAFLDLYRRLLAERVVRART